MKFRMKFRDNPDILWSRFDRASPWIVGIIAAAAFACLVRAINMGAAE